MRRDYSYDLLKGIEILFIGFAIYYNIPGFYLQIPLSEIAFDIRMDCIVGLIIAIFTAISYLLLAIIFHKTMPAILGNKLKSILKP